MAVYKFKGVTASGKSVSGVRNADNLKALQGLLRKEGIFLSEAVGEDEKPAPGEINLGKLSARVSTRELAVITRQLATLLKAGVTLVESLAAVAEQTENPTLKLVVSQVRQRVNEGSSFADALSQHPRVFPELYCNMVRAGESSGALEVVLQRLADFTENQARLRSKIIGTLTYPAIMIVVGLVIVWILMVVVIPKITKIFADRKAELPLPTKILLGVANFIRDWWWLLLLLVVLGLLGLWRYIHTDKGRLRWDRFRLNMPLAGPIIRMLAVSRFAKTLGTLLSSGVPLLNAMSIVRTIVNNQVLAGVLDQAREAIREGESIAAPLKRSGEFPPLVIHMIAVGERSGQLEQMLEHVADSYAEQAESRVSALTTLLEPLMILFMGGAVAFMVLSILLPIMQLNEFAR
jgi:general secretion pathway protein F